ncbi:MAG: MerR family transcriptional regulator [Lactobacillus sp.]|jgi:DNA-binding transcriptional MerR regulator/effector-binding domain-containing protein|nr:MerR family transcriptional regulator [Lactobacillus sp.]MCI2034267.1 MerR family transcriptional regulator [Lactobacillus sp.]
MRTSKENTNLYTVGEVAKLCNVSKKTLRFYDQLGIISPDYVCPDNNYRYYSQQTLSSISIVKYYKQMGFKLSEMQGLIGKPSYFYHENNFVAKINELQEEAQKIHDELIQLHDWHRLLQEARMVSAEYTNTISVKCLEVQSYCSLEQAFSYDYRESILNIPWTNYLQSQQQEITGPVVLKYDSYADKYNGTSNQATIMQKPVLSDQPVPNLTTLGGFFVSTYHLGDLGTINAEYPKVQQWATDNGYTCGPECYERYVVDYWTTTNPEEFVTEILIPISKQKCTAK